MKYMSGDDVLSMLFDIKDAFERNGLSSGVASGVASSTPPIGLDATMTMYSSKIQHDAYSTTYFVGTKELFEDGVEFELGRAMIPVVGLFHEVCGHGGQIRNEFEKSTPLSQVLALNYYACRSSVYYYDNGDTNFSEQYRWQPNEIAAQYMGIKSARTYLSSVYGHPHKNRVRQLAVSIRHERSHCADL